MRKFLLISLLMGLFTALQGNAQDRTVTGRVTATEDGTSLPGVSVAVKGTTRGVITDANGNYKLSVSDGSTLLFQFVGMVSQEVAVGGKSVIDVQLASQVSQLDEIVVTALGIEKQTKSLGFSQANLKNSEIVQGRATNVANALAAKVAGVKVASSNGMVGSSSAIFIRGFTTFTGSNQPLFVVDGIPINNGGGANASQTGVSNSNRAIDLNQDDIESMSILKGPAAAALYGSRAASGAILITTKKGKTDGAKKMAVSYTGSYNIVEVNRYPDYQNEYAQGTMLNATGVPVAPIFQANADQLSWGPRIAGQLVPSAYSAADQALFGLPSQVPLTAYPNNVRDLFRRGSNFQNTLSFSGGTDKSSYYFSYGFVKETGIQLANELGRHNFSVNASSQVSKRLNIGTNISYVNNVSQRSQIGNQLSNPMFRGWFTPRNVDLKNSPSTRPDGSQVFYNGNTDNPFWSFNNNLYNDEVNRIIGNVNAKLDITDWLMLTGRIGTDAFISRIKTADGIGARGQANHAVGGVGAVGDQMFFNQETSSYVNLSAKKKFGDFTVNGLLGNEVNIRLFRNQGVVGNTLATRGFFNILNATNFVPFGTEGRSTLIGAYGSIDASYRDWLFAGFTLRNDWSSTFKAGNRSYLYPSGSVGVILTDGIPALKGEVLSYLKFKGNIAKVGREAGLFATDTYYNNANPGDGFNSQIIFPFLGQQGRTLGNTAGNPLLGPEFTTSREVSVESRFWRNKIGLELTYFWTTSTDIILGVPVASAAGFTNLAKNAGTLETNGWEWNLDFTPVSTKNFKWNIDFNGAKIRNNVIALAPGVTNISLGPFTTAESRIEAGQPYGVLYGNTLLRNAQGKLVVNASGLPIIDTRGLQKVGDPNPNWTGGVTNTISYKGLSLSFLIDIRRGGDLLTRNVGDLLRTGVVKETTEFPRFDASGAPTREYVIPGVYQADGSPNITKISAQQYWGNLYAFNVPGMFVFDATWTRLREASITYNVPKSVLDKTPFSRLEFGVNGRNLLLWTNVPHIDPEVSIGGAGNLQGVEFNALPQARNYGVTLRATF